MYIHTHIRAPRYFDALRGHYRASDSNEPGATRFSLLYQLANSLSFSLCVSALPLYPSQSSPGTSPSFPAAGAFLWPFDASRAPPTLPRHTLFRRTMQSDRLIRSNVRFARGRLSSKVTIGSPLLFPPFSLPQSYPRPRSSSKLASRIAGGNSRRECVRPGGRSVLFDDRPSNADIPPPPSEYFKGGVDPESASSLTSLSSPIFPPLTTPANLTFDFIFNGEWNDRDKYYF